MAIERLRHFSGDIMAKKLAWPTSTRITEIFQPGYH